jgi:hypothetical protein
LFHVGTQLAVGKFTDVALKAGVVVAVVVIVE